MLKTATRPARDYGAVRIEAVPAASVEARVLLALYADEISTAFADGFDPKSALPADPAELTPPRGNFLVVRAEDGNPIGCGTVRMLDPKTAEIKRMWLAPEMRGKGLGRQLLDALEQAARDLGASEARLDTNDTLSTALSLYRNAGWQEITAYNDNAYATHWFAKAL